MECALKKPNVLVVNDHPASLLALKTMLNTSPAAEEYEVVTASSGPAALRELLARRFAAILLDVSMPGMDGFETAELIHAHPSCASVPIIFITAHYADELNRLKGFKHGAADYLISPVVPQILHAKIAVFIELEKKTLQLESQKTALAMFNQNLQIQQMQDLKKVNAALQVEILERRQAERRARDLATKDALTGLINRRFLTEEIRHAIVRAARQGERIALLFLDMDKFKSINDTLGHDAGDELLIHVADRLREAVRESDYVARFGGDEFVVLMEGIHCYTDAADVARKIIDTVSAPVTLRSQRIRPSISVGISMFPDDSTSAQDLLRCADLAMYHAKENKHGGGVQFYHEELNAKLSERRRLEYDMQNALENEEFELYYQPKVDGPSGHIYGVEALLRWHHPRLGMLSGGQFMNVADETGQIVQIGEWVIYAACAQARLWRDADPAMPSLPIAVNIATPQIYADLPAVIDRALNLYNLPSSCLQLEITESLVIDDVKKASSVLREISNRGIKIAIDDFGSGYSSLSVLKALPIDVLKIDQSFVRDLGRGLGDNAIVTAVINMARAMTLRVVAEGVETEEQRTILHDLGCDEHQGFLYSVPLPAGKLEALVMATA
jgi:diguanylate cyclase (GGDEF)-like protein